MNATPKKRKAINDFFIPIAKQQTMQGAKCMDLKTTRIPKSPIEVTTTPRLGVGVPGLEVHHDFVDPNEERELIAFLNGASKCKWRTDLTRRTMHFGGTYCLMPSKANSLSTSKPEILHAPPMPQEMDWLIKRLVDANVFSSSQIPQYCIVNEYTGNLGISAHTENFQFAEPVVGLSLLSACPIRFHELTKPYDGSVRSGKAGKAAKTGKVVDVQMPGRSLLVMRGESRWKWQHEITRSTKGRGSGWKRVSLTFRYKPDS